MGERYITIRTSVESRIEVRRSIFLCQLFPVSDEASMRDIIDSVKKKYWDARHHCTAAIIGFPGSVVERSNDDGEPSGTAGAPMLDVLKGRDLSDVLAITTRWFGGTLLGAGGLSRAYADSVRESLLHAPFIYRVKKNMFQVRVPHEIAGRLESDLRNRGWLDHVEYLDQVHFRLALVSEEVSFVSEFFAERTQGVSSLSPLGVRWVDQSADDFLTA